MMHRNYVYTLKTLPQSCQYFITHSVCVIFVASLFSLTYQKKSKRKQKKVLFYVHDIQSSLFHSLSCTILLS